MLGLIALLLTPAPEAFLRTPDIAGDRVAFSCEGDIWIGDLASRRAVRLTSDEGRETTPRFSPNSKWIAFSGEYDGTREVYVISVDGGAPRRLTFMADNAEPQDWSPDGREILYMARGYPVSFRLYTVPIEGGYPTQLPVEFAANACYAGSKDKVAFTRFQRSRMARFNYGGGQVNSVWVGDMPRKAFVEAASMPKGSCEFPAWADGSLWMATDPDGKFGISRSGAKLALVGERGPEEIRNLASDGNRLIYERGYGLEVLDPKSGKATPVGFDLTSDLIHTRPYLVPADRFAQSATLGPTGKRILVESRGQILSLPTKDGEARVLLAKDGVRFGRAVFSPDSKKIAYVSDETREQQVVVSDADGTNPKQLTHDVARQIRTSQWSPNSQYVLIGDSEARTRLIDVETGVETVVYDFSDAWQGARASFSPDSKWIVFDWVEPVTQYNSVALYEIASKKTTILGKQLAHDFGATFSTDGKYIAFLSKRNFAPSWDEYQNILPVRNTVKVYLLALRNDLLSPLLPKNEEEIGAPKDEKPKDEPFRIDLDGLYDRLIELPVAPKNYTRIEASADRILLQYAEDGTPKVSYFDLKDRSSGVVTEAATSFQLSPDGKKLLLANGPSFRVVDVSAANVPASPAISYGGLQLRIDPKKEWEQIFWDAWRLHRDFFYVKNMNGADWPAIGKRYAAMLPAVRSRDELDQLIKWMQSELSVSHAFNSTGDGQSLFRANPPAFLGVDLAADSSGFYRITNILTGDGYDNDRSPLSAPGLNIKPGDYLIEVAGIPARSGSNFLAGLVGRAGQTVSIKINTKPSKEGARQVYIRPIASERNLRYKEWVKSRAAYVDNASGGKLAYLHLANMTAGEFGHFLQQYMPQRNRDGLVVDVRFNSGGSISDNVNRILKQKYVAMWNARAAATWSRQYDTFLGPKACLINEYCFSDGELFPDQFQQMKIGPLIGRKTSAAEIGSDPGWPLVDGGVVNVPNYGAWRPDTGWIIENSGVKPDIDVASDPNAFAAGRDPQLDKAIAYLLGELRKHPLVRPVQPKDPIRVRSGG